MTLNSQNTIESRILTRRLNTVLAATAIAILILHLEVHGVMASLGAVMAVKGLAVNIYDNIWLAEAKGSQCVWVSNEGICKSIVELSHPRGNLSLKQRHLWLLNHWLIEMLLLLIQIQVCVGKCV